MHGFSLVLLFFFLVLLMYTVRKKNRVEITLLSFFSVKARRVQNSQMKLETLWFFLLLITYEIKEHLFTYLFQFITVG